MLEVRNVTKKLKKKIILDDISYKFEKGKIYGLYGRNGCGKTMFLRAIAGLIFPTQGEIVIQGKTLHKDIDFPEDIGIIIENTTLLPQYTGFTNLKILSKIKGCATDEDIKDALEKVGLNVEDKRKVKEYSLGMKQRLSIAQAIFEKPSLMLLDEPTNALDEESILKVRELFLNFKNNGATIIIASHNKEDLEVLSDINLKMIDGRLA